MSDLFDFVANDEFRNSLRRDFAEVEKAFRNECWKSVLVLSGSIVETVMIDYLIHVNYGNKGWQRICSMTLAEAIDALVQEKVISEKSRDLAAVVKNYRNLIHPGRQIRLREFPDRESANIAQSLVRIIVSEISQRCR